MSRLCRDCGKEVEINPSENSAYCPNCGKTLTPKETLSSWAFEARVAQLTAMHEMMCNANDEEIYYNSWIYVMPDGATEDDIQYIAFNDDLYNECFDLFVRLIKKDGNRW